MPADPHVETDAPMLEVRGLRKYFPISDPLGRTRANVRAIEDVSFSLQRGQTFGLVGESGCGKSTTGRALLRLTQPDEGAVILDGQDLMALPQSDLKAARRHMQMVFQDPFMALNPRKRIGEAIKEALAIHGIGRRSERRDMVLDVLQRVGLQQEHYDKLPHEFSGGQRQRIGLARAIIVKPRLVICDEVVSALDVSVQAQILNLLKRIQKEFDLSYVFISHDLSVVRHMADRVGVMYLGRLVEVASTAELFSAPRHPYTQALMAAIPQPSLHKGSPVRSLPGEIPSPTNPPTGCVFHTRCPVAVAACKQNSPAMTEIGANHQVSCHLA